MSPADSTILIGKQILKVKLAAHRGRVIFDLRYMYHSADDGQLKPTRRGVTINAEAIHEIITALKALENEMVHDGALEFGRDGEMPKFHPHVYPTDF